MFLRLSRLETLSRICPFGYRLTSQQGVKVIAPSTQSIPEDRSTGHNVTGANHTRDIEIGSEYS